ncbi:hypothetical protein HMPREF2955_07185 [Prevotella sp. HMSC073D09]|uniref:DUF3127 domain-containing protein n=1 Tax=Prevotella sp. HMSC073D09 TaxID=1739459 RepID=UPI0008A396AD|nr:DUF3127 domain-containing protein [Prevotella sp. HMSC073D09]OFQ23386.1 hypothetical protein HMPREF2955_07185 [Prevotella sp. HMSC073D09]
MDIQGKVIAVLPEKTGVSAKGEWKVQEYVIETHEAYPHKMVFSVFGADRIARFNVQVGQEVMVSFDIDAHEYQGRWFNSIRAYDVRLVDPAQFGVPAAAPQATQAAPAGFPPQQTASAAPAGFPPAQDAPAEDSSDDLPF